MLVIAPTHQIPAQAEATQPNVISVAMQVTWLETVRMTKVISATVAKVMVILQEIARLLKTTKMNAIIVMRLAISHVTAPKRVPTTAGHRSSATDAIRRVISPATAPVKVATNVITAERRVILPEIAPVRSDIELKIYDLISSF